MDRMTLDHTHNPSAQSWLESANEPDTPFPIQNLPFGRILRDNKPHVVVAVGDRALDLTALEQDVPAPFVSEGRLDGLAFGDKRRELRQWLFSQLQDPGSQLKSREQAWLPQQGLRYLLPFEVGDYTDFYASIHHATRVGSMFRPDNPLLPNYKWVPIGYHGRASSLIVSGTPVRRPSGQLKADDAEAPVFGPCKMLDYELELGLWVGKPNMLGQPIGISDVRDHWIGVSLVNDWSARDIQKWEYQPLGPFLAKSFATTVSPWVVTQEALAPFATAAAARDTPPLPYLLDDLDQQQGGLDLELEVWLRTAQMNAPHRVSKSNPRDLYWTLGQMLVHHASNGCPMRTGDLLASGTVSGPEPEAAGCLLELTWQGPGQPRRAVQLGEEKRTFLLDGDEVTLSGWGRKQGHRTIGLGSCSGVIEG
jgi:fumarylacetoacetase